MALTPLTHPAATPFTPPPFTHPRALVGMDWRFNGWGDLYGSFEQDKLVATKICEVERLPYASVDMVLEGGSFHTDGEGCAGRGHAWTWTGVGLLCASLAVQAAHYCS